MSHVWKALFVGDTVIQEIPDQNFMDESFRVLMNTHDIRSCNFEAPVRGTSNPIKKAGPVLSQNEEAPSFLQSIGFNFFNLANNHIYDFGQEGLAKTIACFKNGMVAGAGLCFDDAYQLKQFRINDTHLGLLSFGEAEFGALVDRGSNRGGYAWINHPMVNDIVREATKLVDVLIIQNHGGIEETSIPLPEWRARYKELIHLGASAIIASHPHVPQGWETFDDKPIFYILGNFYFDAKSSEPFWNKGLAVSLTFAGNRLQYFDVIGTLFKKGRISINTDPQFPNYLRTLNESLDEPAYSKSISSMVDQLWENRYKNYYEIAMHSMTTSISMKHALKYFVSRLFFKRKLAINEELLMHNIRIESHRWVVERALSRKTNL
jgi:hypothetical protein